MATPARSILSEISGNRVQGGELSLAQRACIISKVEEGYGQRRVASLCGCSKTAVSNTLKRLREHNTIYSMPRSGRPAKISQRQKRLLYRAVRKTPKINYKRLKSEVGLHHVSHSTIYRTLRKMGLVHKICVKRPKLTAAVAKLRLKFARAHRNFNWKRRVVKFSDECSIEVGSGADREWCFRFAKEKYDPIMVQEKEKSKRPSQMVWASFWVTPNGRVGRSPLVIMRRDPGSKRGGYSAKSYLETLDEGLRPNYRPGDIFVQDNAPIHTANVTKLWLEEHGIWVLEWPPFSPDLNPIEHLWYALKKQLYKDYPHLRDIVKNQETWDEFCIALQECWKRLPNSLLRRLIESLPDRLAAVRAAKGWQTKY